jgi:glycosyltransferase involved in cell wall biosynthesis
VVGGRLPRLVPAFDAAPPVVIGWMGTRTHDADLAAIAPALHELARRHGPRVRFECVGVLEHPTSRGLLDGLDVHYVTPRPQELEYPLFMLWFTSRIHWDIGLAALADTPFTRGKSDLKSLDYAAIGAAGIYSDVPAYRNGVVHGETGWLVANTAEDWTDGLDRLVTDAALRERLAIAAARALYAERTLARRAGDWLDAVTWLLDDSQSTTWTHPWRLFGARTMILEQGA